MARRISGGILDYITPLLNGVHEVKAELPGMAWRFAELGKSGYEIDFLLTELTNAAGATSSARERHALEGALNALTRVAGHADAYNQHAMAGALAAADVSKLTQRGLHEASVAERYLVSARRPVLIQEFLAHIRW